MLYGTESTAGAGWNVVSDYVVAVVAAAAAGAASNAPQIISSASIKQFSRPGHCEFIHTSQLLSPVRLCNNFASI